MVAVEMRKVPGVTTVTCNTILLAMVVAVPVAYVPLIWGDVQLPDTLEKLYAAVPELVPTGVKVTEPLPFSLLYSFSQEASKIHRQMMEENKDKNLLIIFQFRFVKPTTL